MMMTTTTDKVTPEAETIHSSASMVYVKLLNKHFNYS